MSRTMGIEEDDEEGVLPPARGGGAAEEASSAPVSVAKIGEISQLVG